MAKSEHQKNFKNRHISLRIIGYVLAFIFACVALYFAIVFAIRYNEDDQAFFRRKQDARHIAIDEINSKTVYLIIYKGDTLGVVIEP